MAGADASLDIQILDRASSKLGGRHRAPGNSTNPSCVRKADEGEEQSDTNSAGRLDGRWDQLAKPLPHSSESQGNKDPAFHEHGGQGKAIGYRARAMVSDNLIGKIGIQAHSGAIWPPVSCPGRTVIDAYGTHARATGRLVKKPKRQLARPDKAAVAVIRSRFTSENC